MKKFVFVCLLAALTLVPAGPASNKAYFIKTVVIDAGHGGHDTGCLGSSAREKDITLSVALKLGKLLEDEFPDIRVVYTRKSDQFVELYERAGIANRAKADLFVCIHANSGSPAAFGTETYVMGLHKTDENLAVSRRENASVLLEADYKKKYDGFDPNSPEANIIFTLFQNAFMNQSLSFASKVQLEFEEYAGRYNRGVKQAGFLVLYRTSMPAVLIETGFLTNKAEEKYLLSRKGEDDISQSILRAFRAYKIDMEAIGQPPPAVPQQVEEKPATGKQEKNAGDTARPAKPKDETVLASNSKKPAETPPAATPKKETQPAKEQPVESPKPESAGAAEGNNATATMDFFYTVQIGASASNRKDGLEKLNVKGMRKIAGDDGFTRFTVGHFENLNDAMKSQTELRKQGFSDAFVTPYLNGKRISLKEAAKIETKN